MKINKQNSIITLKSPNPGKTTTIMVGVHGDELAGVYALQELLKGLKIFSGKVYFIFANLKALEIEKREFQKNMNRCFLSDNKGNTYEDKRAREIMKYLEKSDYLLDVHNTLNEKSSIPFLISEYRELGKYFDVDLVISGFDKLHPGGSDSYMNKIGKVGLCLESGSIYYEKGLEIAKKGITNFLKFTKNIDGKASVKKGQKFINFSFMYRNNSLDFKYVKKFLDFEKVYKGQLIAHDGIKEVFSNIDGYIMFAYIPKKIGDECFCLGESV